MTAARPTAWLVAALGLGPVLVQTGRLETGQWWAAPVAITGIVLLEAGRRWPRWFVPMSAVAFLALSVGLGGSDGPKVAAMTIVGLGLWAAALDVVPVAPVRLPGGVALRPALIPLVVADGFLLFGSGFRVPAVALVGAALVAVAASIRPAAFAPFGTRITARVVAISQGIVQRAQRRLDERDAEVQVAAEGTLAPGRWMQLPSRMLPDVHQPLWPPLVLAVVPVALVAHRLDQSWWVAAIAVAAAVVVVGCRTRPSRLLPVAALAGVALAIVLEPGNGFRLAAITVIGAAVWGLAWGAIADTSVRTAPWAAPEFAPAAAVLLAGDAWLVFGGSIGTALVLVVVAGLLAGAGALWPQAWGVLGAAVGDLVAVPKARVLDLVRWIAAAVGKLILVIVMIPAAIVVSVMWLIYRIVGHDALGAPAEGPGRWVDRNGGDSYPQRFYASVPVTDRRPMTARMSSAAVAVVVLGLLAGGIALARREPVPAEPLRLTEALPTTSQCAAMPDLATAPDTDPELLRCETAEAVGHLDFYAPSVFRISDFTGRTVNVEDGVRRTWSPPACDCTRLTVWWFGGSAAWGEGQRDLYTLPSQLARVAHDEGYELDIVNFGQTTYTLGMEVSMFANQTTLRPPPDLIVFYDGGNDLMFQGLRARNGDPDDGSPIALQERQLDDLLRNGFPIDPDAVEHTPDPPLPEVTDEFVDTAVETAMDRYGDDADLARRIAASIDRPVSIVWQPLLATAPAEAGTADAIGADEREIFKRFVEAAQPRIPDDVVDLSRVFDDTTFPVFIDLFHTNELGARLVAEALLDQLEPQLQAATEDREGE